VKFFGIPVRFDVSALLLIYILALNGFSIASAETPAVRVVSALLLPATLIFSILFHERAHILAASRYGIGCRGITLLLFGGFATLESMGKRPREMFVIAIAGPLSSLLLAGIGLALSLAGQVFFGNALPPLVSNLLSIFTFLNMMLALFNILPVYPLDGGRMLHSALWDRCKDMEIARRQSIKVARIVIVVLFGLLLIGVVAGKVSVFSFVWFVLLAALLWQIQNRELKL